MGCFFFFYIQLSQRERETDRQTDRQTDRREGKGRENIYEGNR